MLKTLLYIFVILVIISIVLIGSLGNKLFTDAIVSPIIAAGGACSICMISIPLFIHDGQCTTTILSYLGIFVAYYCYRFIKNQSWRLAKGFIDDIVNVGSFYKTTKSVRSKVIACFVVEIIAVITPIFYEAWKLYSL